MTPEFDQVTIGTLKPYEVALLQNIAEAAAQKAVEKTFVAMGLDPNQPINAQRDFAFLRSITDDGEFKADMEWVRRSRRRSEGVVGKMIAGAVGLGLLGAADAIWTGVQTIIGKH